MKNERFEFIYGIMKLVLLLIIAVFLIKISLNMNGRYQPTSNDYVILDTKTGELFFSYNGKLSKFPGEHHGI